MNRIVRRIIRREDGVTIVMVLAFMALSVPIVTAALGLASTLSIDSRVKGDIAKRQFSAIGANELAIQRLTNDDLPGPDGNGIPDLLEEDNNGIDDGDGVPDIWEDNDGDGIPDGYQETVTINDEDIVIDITPDLPAPLEAPKADGLVVVKTLLDYSPKLNYSPYAVPPGTQTGWAHYEILITNMNDVGTPPIELRRVFDGLPLEFEYKGETKLDGAPIKDPDVVNTYTLDPAEEQLLFDETEPLMGVREMLTWNIFEEKKIEVWIGPGEHVSLTYKAKFADLPDGVYCNVAWTEPEAGDFETRTGMTAPLQVGDPANTDCLGSAITIVTKATAILNPNELPLNPNDDVEISYEIIIRNSGSTDVSMWALRNKLPPGFQYQYGTTSGDITFTDPELYSPGIGYTRTRLLWFWSVVGTEIPIQAGTEKTLMFKALAPRDAGLYRNEVWAFFTEFNGYPTVEEQRAYSWPSAPVFLADVFKIKLDGKPTAMVWIVDGKAIVRRWEIN